MKYLKSLLYIATLSLATGFVAAATKDSIVADAVNSQWENSFSEGNTDVLMTLYSDNAVVISPSSEIFDNRTEIQTYLEGLKKVGVKKYAISNVELEVKGNLAYETAYWEGSWVNAEGAIFNFEGNITNVFEKQDDGSWKIKLQSWN
jgi:ketosteroid isomerase-like protein